jgi:hypothetical protein
VKINPAVLLVLFLLVAVVGWFAASAASPRIVTLLMGMAVGMIITMPLTLFVARILWSDELRAMRRRERRHSGYQASPVMGYPPVIMVPPGDPEATEYDESSFALRREDPERPLIYYLGED